MLEHQLNQVFQQAYDLLLSVWLIVSISMYKYGALL